MRQIRSYRRPLPRTFPGGFQPSDGQPFGFTGWKDGQSSLGEYEDVFIVSENPLLELTHADLCFLRERGIDPFRDDGK